MEAAKATLRDGRVREIWGAGSVGFGRSDHAAESVASLQSLSLWKSGVSASRHLRPDDAALKGPLFRKQIHYKFTNLLHLSLKQNLQVSAHPSNLVRSVNEFVGLQKNASRPGVRNCCDLGNRPGFRPKRRTEQRPGRSDALERPRSVYGVCAARASRRGFGLHASGGTQWR